MLSQIQNALSSYSRFSSENSRYGGYIRCQPSAPRGVSTSKGLGKRPVNGCVTVTVAIYVYSSPLICANGPSYPCAERLPDHPRGSSTAALCCASGPSSARRAPGPQSGAVVVRIRRSFGWQEERRVVRSRAPHRRNNLAQRPPHRWLAHPAQVSRLLREWHAR